MPDYTLEDTTLKKAAIFIGFVLITTNAYSYTECTSKINNVYVGDGGNVMIFYEGGGSAVIPPGNDLKNALSVALAAFMGDKQVTVRYSTSGQSCDANLVNDFRGIRILRN